MTGDMKDELRGLVKEGMKDELGLTREKALLPALRVTCCSCLQVCDGADVGLLVCVAVVCVVLVCV